MNSLFAFGPVPSRRLGRSLGINNIPPKSCSYSCIYCQVGRTTDMGIERRSFYPVDDLCTDVLEKVRQATAAREHIDYLTFVPDGEPTLDANLGAEIVRLRPLGIKIAVISNASLVWRADVREDLAHADWVSLKVDAVRDEVWRKINRPHRALELATILDGMLRFARVFRGELVTETMLARGINDSVEHIQAVGAFLARLNPARVYLSIPTRPPAEDWAQPPTDDVLNRSYQFLSARLNQVEYLIGYEGNAFASTGNVAEDLLAITAVHPMREDAVRSVLARAGVGWSTVQSLLDQGQLIVTEFNNERFYTRRIKETNHERH
jgi:wyosine [tRNA(Phe)-imidazoG37] synthetase (radical SAM superfamily)